MRCTFYVVYQFHVECSRGVLEIIDNIRFDLHVKVDKCLYRILPKSVDFVLNMKHADGKADATFHNAFIACTWNKKALRVNKAWVFLLFNLADLHADYRFLHIPAPTSRTAK
jgi:hypothetical protein